MVRRATDREQAEIRRAASRPRPEQIQSSAQASPASATASF